MAQLVAHHTGSVGVTGSSPVSSTKNSVLKIKYPLKQFAPRLWNPLNGSLDGDFCVAARSLGWLAFPVVLWLGFVAGGVCGLVVWLRTSGDLVLSGAGWAGCHRFHFFGCFYGICDTIGRDPVTDSTRTGLFYGICDKPQVNDCVQHGLLSQIPPERACFMESATLDIQTSLVQ